MPASSATATQRAARCEIEVERLFAEHRLAGARAGFDQVRVRVRGARDQHRVDGSSAIACCVERRALAPCNARERRSGRGIRVGDAGKPAPRQCRDVAGVYPADAAGADESESAHASGSAPLLYCRAVCAARRGTHS